MNTPNLGRTPADGALRDAIHVAVIPRVADRNLYPGEKVGYGIVDPWRSGVIPAGTSYWFLLNPGTATGMRHQWEHPAFDDEAGSPADSDEDIVATVARLCGRSRERMLEIARRYAVDPDDWERMERDSSELYKAVTEEQWEAFWVSIGRSPDVGVPFTCSC